MSDDTYPMPAHGWTCFHCGETFKTPGAAQIHFGFDPSSDPGCRIKVGAERGLLMALRKAEEELATAGADAVVTVRDMAIRMAEMQGRHSDALRSAEEHGYERGWPTAKPRGAAPTRWQRCGRGSLRSRSHDPLPP